MELTSLCIYTLPRTIHLNILRYCLHHNEMVQFSVSSFSPDRYRTRCRYLRWDRMFVKSDSVFLRFPWLLTSLYCSSLIDFMPLIYFDTLWKHQKTRGFLMFSGRGYQKRSVTWNGLIEIVLCGTRLIRQNWKFRKKLGSTVAYCICGQTGCVPAPCHE